MLCLRFVSKIQTYSLFLIAHGIVSLSANCVLIVLHSLDHRKLRTPTPESTVLHVGCLTRNVNEAHLEEIFGMYAEFSIPMSSRHVCVAEFWNFFVMCLASIYVDVWIFTCLKLWSDLCVLVCCRKLWGGCERGAGYGSLCKSPMPFFQDFFLIA